VTGAADFKVKKFTTLRPISAQPLADFKVKTFTSSRRASLEVIHSPPVITSDLPIEEKAYLSRT
jgi:hypothetical protein